MSGDPLPRCLLPTVCVALLMVAACRVDSPYVGSKGDDRVVEEIGLWEQRPPNYEATYHVRPPGQTYGDGDGSSWDNALSGLPEELQRGARYYFAAGDYYEGEPTDRYHSHVLDDPEDGDRLIGLFKATVEEHGDGAGWQDDLAQGPVRFGPVAIVTGYYALNGREGYDSGEYGIEIHSRDCARRAQTAAGAPLAFPFDSQAHHVSVQQVEVADCGPSTDVTGAPQDAVLAVEPVSQLTLRECTVRDAWRSLLRLEGAFDVLVERTFLLGAGDHPEASAVAIVDSRNVVLRRSWLADASGAFVTLERTRNVILSANVLVQTDGAWSLDAAVRSRESALHTWVVGNTLYGLQGLDVGVRTEGALSDFQVVNNLWAMCVAEGLTLGPDHGHNAFFDNRTPDNSDQGSLDALLEEPTAQWIQVDPFVNAAVLDLMLIVPTEPGASVIEPFVGVDYDGLSRGGDGLWDRGAYEYRAP